MDPRDKREDDRGWMDPRSNLQRQPSKIFDVQFLGPRRWRYAKPFQNLFSMWKHALQTLSQHFAALAEACGCDAL